MEGVKVDRELVGVTAEETGDRTDDQLSHLILSCLVCLTSL